MGGSEETEKSSFLRNETRRFYFLDGRLVLADSSHSYDFLGLPSFPFLSLATPRHIVRGCCLRPNSCSAVRHQGFVLSASTKIERRGKGIWSLRRF